MIRVVAGLTLLLGVASLAGCVRRTLAITSEPAGATVLLDGRNVGTTPLEMPFTWYGNREIILFIEPPTPEEAAADAALDPRAYRLSTMVTLDRPWHQAPGADAASHLLYPGAIEDRRSMHFELEQVRTPGENAATDRSEMRALRERAEELRGRAQDATQPDSPSGP